MENKIREILEAFEDLDPIIAKRLINDLGRNDPVEIVYSEMVDHFGTIYVATCPSCGENLRFDRYSQIVQQFNYCYRCGQKLRKNSEQVEK